jgi:hypothetical protein
MRFRVRVVLCLLALIAGFGCRKPLTPNVDRNLAPETWITAAPIDSLTQKDANGNPIFPDLNNYTIPVRFHMFWAGSDRDGAIAGYFWAVTETTLSTINPDGGPPGPPPPLPGPKPGDYHFTTRTDTSFIFNVSEQQPDRQHAFYIYAVDNQGKGDPTPAHFVFIALDKFPPRPVIEVANATGTIVNVNSDGSVTPEVRTYGIRDTFNINTAPSDTVPANSRLDFRWHGEITLAGTYVTKYRYKLDEPSFITADSSVHSVSYNTGLPGSAPLSVGQKIFTLRALDQAGGAGQTTRRFIMNFSPDTWWSGPNPALFPTTPSTGDGRSVVGFSGVVGTLLSSDSLQLRPALRPVRRTFFEIYQDRLYARSEGDTVHMNSYIALFNGGYDKDSRYTVRVDTIDIALPHDGNGNVILSPVIQRDGVVGSPIGFRSRVLVRLDPSGRFETPQSTLYPVYEPVSVFRSTRIGNYLIMRKSGKAYAIAKAEDGDGGLDNTVVDPIALADRVDAGGGTAAEVKLREKVLTFYVNKSPTLLDIVGGVPNAAFRPAENSSFSGVWNFNLLAADQDPYNPSDPAVRPGGPTESVILRYKVTLFGKNLAGNDTTWTYFPSIASTSPYFFTPQITFQPSVEAPYLAHGPVAVIVELCDCRDCEFSAGDGRCITKIFHVTYTGPQPDPNALPGGPGSASSRSK